MHAESGAAVSAAEMKTESHSLDRYRVHLLAILALINFVNFADRLVVPPLVPLLRDHFALSSAQLSALQIVLQFVLAAATVPFRDRKSTRLNSSHVAISYAVFCLKKKKKSYRNNIPATPATR